MKKTPLKRAIVSELKPIKIYFLKETVKNLVQIFIYILIYIVSRTDGNKIYITDSNGEELNKFYKPYEVLRITETQRHESASELVSVKPFDYMENLKNKRQERTDEKTQNELKFDILNFRRLQGGRVSRLPRRFG